MLSTHVFPVRVEAGFPADRLELIQIIDKRFFLHEGWPFFSASLGYFAS
jgi:hypothetical protein